MDHVSAEQLAVWATGLRIGGRRRVQHECGEGNTMLVSRDAEGSRCFCFRCGQRGFHRDHESLADRLARLNSEQVSERLARSSCELPGPRQYDTRDWPLDLKVWFYKSGFSLNMLKELGVYYCTDIGRAVLPIMEDGQAVYWTARSQTRQPKWLTPAIAKDGLVAKYGGGRGDSVVLTEDPLSAFKVGQVCEAWSLLGTKMADSTLAALVESRKRVAVWLDNDLGRGNGSNPGQISAKKILARLRAFGVEVRNITSLKDPKAYDGDYIRSRLNE